MLIHTVKILHQFFKTSFAVFADFTGWPGLLMKQSCTNLLCNGNIMLIHTVKILHQFFKTSFAVFADFTGWPGLLMKQSCTNLLCNGNIMLIHKVKILHQFFKTKIKTKSAVSRRRKWISKILSYRRLITSSSTCTCKMKAWNASHGSKHYIPT